MSSLRKMLSILDLFTEEQSTIYLDEIVRTLNVSVPTGYRYLKELCDAGLLAKIDGGGYIIGPKIIKLDRQIRATDPVISAGKPVMKKLVQKTGCEVLLSNIYNEEVLNVHVEAPTIINTTISYNRGRPHPIYKGATAKVILPYLSRNRLSTLYKENKEKIAEEGLGESWKEFLANLGEWKKQGYCITHGELDKENSGIAAPIFYQDQIIGSLTLVLPTNRFEVYNVDKLIELVKDAANEISLVNSKERDQEEKEK